MSNPLHLWMDPSLDMYTQSLSVVIFHFSSFYGHLTFIYAPPFVYVIYCYLCINIPFIYSIRCAMAMQWMAEWAARVLHWILYVTGPRAIGSHLLAMCVLSLFFASIGSLISAWWLQSFHIIYPSIPTAIMWTNLWNSNSMAMNQKESRTSTGLWNIFF